MKLIVITAVLLTSSSLWANASSTLIPTLMAKEINQMRIAILGQVGPVSYLCPPIDISPDQVQRLNKHYNTFNTSAMLAVATQSTGLLDEAEVAKIFNKDEAKQVVDTAKRVFLVIKGLGNSRSMSANTRKYGAKWLSVDEDKVKDMARTVKLIRTFAKALYADMGKYYHTQALIPVYKALLDEYGDLFAEKTKQQLDSLLQQTDGFQEDYYDLAAAFITNETPTETMREVLSRNEPNWGVIEFAFKTASRAAEEGASDYVKNAIKSNDNESLGMLMDTGFPSNKVLLQATHYLDNKQAELLAFEHGADINQALHDAQSLYDDRSAEEINKFLIERGADANLALLSYALNYDLSDDRRKSGANKLIERLGADPFLISMFVKEHTGGYRYLAKTEKAKNLLSAPMRIVYDGPDLNLFRSILEEGTSSFIKKLEHLTPNYAQQYLNDEGAKTSIGLVLLYLARQKNTTLAKYVVEQLDGDPASVAAVAQMGGDEEAAAFLRKETIDLVPESNFQKTTNADQDTNLHQLAAHE